MALFGLFSNKKKDNNISIPFNSSQESSDSSLVEAKEAAAVTNEPAPESNSLMITCSTGWPIDIIYGYLHKNYESKGYDDSMINSNLAFRDMNMNIIRHKILMVFREVNLNYDAMKQDIDTRIETCNAAGLLTTAADLNKQLTIINAHKDELSQLELDFRNNANEASVPLMSYECGFLRGVSTIAMAGSGRVQTEKNTISPTINAQSIAI